MKKRALIIEDDKDTSDILSFLTGQLNLEVSTSNSALLVSDIKLLAPDIIILDHWVGAELGGDLCRKLKSKESTKDIPVILISAAIDLEQIADDCSADAYLKKPFDVDDIMGLVTNLLYKKEA
jgi:DNA-binding response OmpR family regulator